MPTIIDLNGLSWYYVYMNKICTICKEDRPVTDFYFQIMKNGKRRISSYCKPCHWLKIKTNPSYKQNRKRAGTNFQKKIRLEVIEFLGGKCLRCGFTDPRALQLDHLYSNGSQDRVHRSWQVMYREIISGQDKSIQLLCANCNWIKRDEQRECFGKRKDS